MQRTMLAAVQATDERLIALWYLMRISAHLAFLSAQSMNNHVTLACQAYPKRSGL